MSLCFFHVFAAACEEKQRVLRKAARRKFEEKIIFVQESTFGILEMSSSQNMQFRQESESEVKNNNVWSQKGKIRKNEIRKTRKHRPRNFLLALLAGMFIFDS